MIDKQVAVGFSTYLAGLIAGVTFLPLREMGVWPLMGWTVFCVALRLVIAEAAALSSAINKLPIDRERRNPVLVKVRAAQKRSRHG